MAKKGNDILKTLNNDSSTGSHFKTLFGEIPEQSTSSNSLFSENNPFRRNLQETPKQKRDLGAKDVGNEALEDFDSAELKDKKKRKKESSDLGGETIEGDNEKSKEDELKGLEKIDDSSTHLPGDGKSGDLGVENEKKKKKKKKRKRDEVEAEYEAKRYGMANGNETIGGSDSVGGKRKKMDNPEDSMVSKERFDDESKLLRTVFVGNLPLKIKKKELVKEFGKFGEVESVRIRSVPIVDGKIPRKGAVIQKRFNENGDSVHAYIVFKTEDCAQASLTHNMTVVCGNHIRVDRACPPRKKLKGDNSLLYENKRTVFVGNLPFDVKDEEIYQLFSGIKNLESSVEAVRVIRDPGTSLGKGIAYVLLKTKVKYKENLSYQGMRASKSGIQKKVVPGARTGAPVKSRSEPATEQKLRENKRPAVAARKKQAHEDARKRKSKEMASGSRLVGTKRKFGSQTPESAGQKKKARKFR